MERSNLKEKEINKAILEWLKSKNLNNTLNAFIDETGLTESDMTKNNQLERKWNSIVSQQKKISDQEAYIKQLKEDLENASMGGGGSAPNGIVNKTNEFMVIFIKKIIKILGSS